MISRYLRTEELQDLDESLRLAREALRLIPKGHPRRGIMLSVLSNLQYDDEALQRVASRISANFWSQQMPSPESGGMLSDVLRQNQDGRLC